MSVGALKVETNVRCAVPISAYQIDRLLAERRVCRRVDRKIQRPLKQGKVENVEEYVAALKHLAKTCRFGMLKEELIRGQSIMHVSNPNIQDELWVNGEAPLKDVIALVKKAELTGWWAKAVEGELQEFKQLNIIKRGKIKNSSVNTKSKDMIRQSNRSECRKCYRCGSVEHLANNKKCPAKNQKCSSCNRIGHFSRVCRNNMSVKVKYIQEEEQYQSSSDKQDGDADTNGVFCIEYDMVDIEQGARKKTMCEIRMGETRANVIADSGSPFTIVDKSVWNNMFVKEFGEHLEKTDVKAKSYTDKVEGCVEEEECVSILFYDGMIGIDEQEWKETMKGDKELQTFITFVNNGWPEKKLLTQTGRSFCEVRDEFSEEQGLLLRCGKVVSLTLLQRKNMG
ncbi:hypothetical protein NDU88_004357 [Pleurodeles waltl]|uniref:CCHC-type domain-containing protein n=1 Tax=Pleurodeles waltl TaxID=8319 RepID=A0AAV7TS83_PLEWA|nr:hypothetical protein NDU88_004357 [Pleurodeles waltl]